MDKARLLIEGSDEPLECRFNPAELRVSKSNQWKPRRTKGVNAPQLVFERGGSSTLTLSLTFDVTDTDEPASVTDYTDRLLTLMRIDEELPGSKRSSAKARPPWVEFEWGPLHSFRAVVENLELTYTYFARDGTPLRAKADLTLKQYEDDSYGLQNPTSHTPNPHRTHRVQPGETLDRIAARYYGQPAGWRRIAEANGVVDPLQLAAGTRLMIPEPKARRRG